MDFKLLSSDDELEEYDRLIDIAAGGTIFHKSWWLRTCCRDEGINANMVDIYGAYENGKLIAALPLPYKNKFFKTWITNPKLTPYLGTIYRDDGLEKECTKNSFIKNVNVGFAKIIRQRGVCLNYIFNLNNVDMLPFIWNNFDVNVNYTYILELEDLQSIWNDMDKTRRHDIKKFYKNAHSIRYSDIDAFIDLNNMTMKRQRHAQISGDLWKNIYQECKRHGCAEVFTIYIDNKPLASLLLVWDNKRVYYIAGGIDNNSEGGMSLLFWEAFKFTKEKLALNEFDFEGSMIRGIEHYFRNFGGCLKPYYGLRDKRLDILLDIKECIPGVKHA
jgi:hypothetical protein